LPDSIDSGEAWLNYDWMALIRDVIQQNLHATHRSSAGGEVHLMTWGSDRDIARQVLTTAEQYLAEIEEIAGAYKAAYMLFVVDDEIDDRFCGAATVFLDVHLARINPDPRCDLEVTVVHEMTHLAKTSGIARWFDEGLATYVAPRVTGRDLEERIEIIHDRLGSPTFRPDLFHYGEGEIEEIDENIGAAGFLFLYEFQEIAGVEALAQAVQRVSQDRFGQDILNGFYFAAPEEVRDQVQDLVARLCRYGEKNAFTGERLGAGSNCTVPVLNTFP
jgi:hypothetical protein